MTSKFLTNSINWLRKSVSDAEHLASITGDSTPPMTQNGGKFPQCGNFMIFLSLTFYVKSILENVRVEKMPFLRL